MGTIGLSLCCAAQTAGISTRLVRMLGKTAFFLFIAIS
jgi:hypothetical protein